LPNNCETSFTYGVSPHPAQAPENSKYGFSNWIPFTVDLLKGFGNCLMVCKNSQLLFCFSTTDFNGLNVKAFCLAIQLLIQAPQPVQSQGLAWMIKFAFCTPSAVLDANPIFSAFCASSCETKKLRMTACGQTKIH
jgi:hypothetical protein